VTLAVTQRHVTMADVDVSQAFFGRYFAWMDDGLAALLRELQRPMHEIFAEGFGTPVVAARCSYDRPVRLGDVVTVTTAVVETRRSSFDIGHVLRVEGLRVAQGLSTHVWMVRQPQARPEPLPAWLIHAAERPKDYDLTSKETT